MKPTTQTLSFPPTCAAFGAVRSITYTARKATVTTCDGRKVRVNRSQLPPFEKWSAFNLADAIA
jgi:hypothetical protein